MEFIISTIFIIVIIILSFEYLNIQVFENKSKVYLIGSEAASYAGHSFPVTQVDCQY